MLKIRRKPDGFQVLYRTKLQNVVLAESLSTGGVEKFLQALSDDAYELRNDFAAVMDE